MGGLEHKKMFCTFVTSFNLSVVLRMNEISIFVQNIVQSKFVIRNGLIRNKLVLRNHFL